MAAVSKTVLIAGAGALGSTAAYVLARAGHRVTVFDPAPPGANASGVAAGMLAPAFECLFDGEGAQRFALLKAARDAWPALAEEIGLPLDRSGAMAVGSEDQAAGWLAALRALGAEVEAAACPGGPRGVFTGEDWRLEPGDALGRLREAAETRLGVRFEPRGLDAKASADAVVIATGAGQALSSLAPELAALTPVKGHILRAAARLGAGPVLRSPGVYLCCSETELVLGATMEAGRGDLDVDPAVVARLIAAAAPLADGLDALAWRAAVGVRAASPDGLPLVGASRAGGGVLLAVGARRNGWLLAPMVAARVLDAVESRAGPHAALFDPQRFSPC